MFPPPPPPPPPPPEVTRVTVVETENGGMNPEEDQPIPGFILTMNIVTTVTQMVLGAVAILAISFAMSMNSLVFISSSLSNHIYLCTIGYVILMSQAILTLSPFSGWAQTLKIHRKRRIHWVMQVCGSTLAIAGSAIRIADVTDNFATTHGILGLVAMVFTIISLIGGIANLLIGTKNNSLLLKLFHAVVGTLTVTMAFIALIYGFNDTFYRTLSGDNTTNLAIALTALALVGTVLSAGCNIFRRILS